LVDDPSQAAAGPLNRAVHRDIVSPFCALTCDDLQVTVENNRIAAVEGGCDFCKERFLTANDDQRPTASVHGNLAALDSAIRAAADELAGASSPLIVGLERLTCEAQSLAVSLADRLGATIDTWGSLAATSRGTPLQRYGESTCTLGELRDRADFVLFWGRRDYAVAAHFVERFLHSGRHGKETLRNTNRPYIVLVEEQTAEETANCLTGRVPVSTFADHVIRITPRSTADAVCIARAILREVQLNTDVAERTTGVSLGKWQRLIERCKQCRYGVVCTAYDDFLMYDDREAIAATHQLAVELSEHTRFALLNCCGAGNAVGAEQLLAWRTGFPNSINLAAGHPRFGPREFTIDQLLARGEVDAILTFDTMLWATLSEAALRTIARIPVVVVNPAFDGAVADYVREQSARWIEFNAAMPGLQAGGTWFRFDGVPLPLRRVVSSLLPTAEQILQLLIARLGDSHD
jgi:formylmethanofuran dehydrogenase subunit B